MDDFIEKPKKPKPIRESAIEKHWCDEARKRGGLPYKFTSPGRNAVPDRLMLEPIAEEHREIVALYVRFIEFKRPGEKPTPPQLREHELLRSKGYKVLVIDSKDLQ